MRFRTACLAASILTVVPSMGRSAIVINEMVIDDGSTDDREFVELYNSGPTAVAIGGWVFGGQDTAGANTSTTITAGATIAPGGYYVIGQTGVPNANQTISSIFENDAETFELRNGAALVDAILVESSKGPTGTSNSGYGTLSGAITAEVGSGIWGEIRSNDLATAGLATASIGRFVDGVDTNVNGRDFGMRLATPGTSNTSPGITTRYVAPNVDAIANDAEVSGFSYAFSAPKAITPGTISGFNKNAIPAAPIGTKVITAWDSTGGGAGVANASTMVGGGRFDFYAYIDTNDLPVSTNSTNVAFRGSEMSIFGLGGGSSIGVGVSDLTDLTGVGALTSTNGITGIAWVYEKYGAVSATDGTVSEKLFLVDARDGGESAIGNTGFDWQILATIDLSTTASNWFGLGININPDGSGTAYFGSQQFTFNTVANLNTSFYSGYRENTQAGSVTVPNYLRAPTWAVPEPVSLTSLGVLGSLLVRRRK